MFVYEWHCPTCGLTDRTDRLLPNRFHPCAKLGGLATPMLRAGVKGTHTAVLRQDYAGGEVVRRDDAGRVVQSIVTTRDDGQDVTVFAPLATVKGTAHG